MKEKLIQHIQSKLSYDDAQEWIEKLEYEETEIEILQFIKENIESLYPAIIDDDFLLNHFDKGLLQSQFIFIQGSESLHLYKLQYLACVFLGNVKTTVFVQKADFVNFKLLGASALRIEQNGETNLLVKAYEKSQFHLEITGENNDCKIELYQESLAEVKAFDNTSLKIDTYQNSKIVGSLLHRTCLMLTTYHQSQAEINTSDNTVLDIYALNNSNLYIKTDDGFTKITLNEQSHLAQLQMLGESIVKLKAKSPLAISEIILKDRANLVVDKSLGQNFANINSQENTRILSL